MGLSVSIDVDELIQFVPTVLCGLHRLYVSRENFTRLCIHYKESYDSSEIKVRGVIFVAKPSITAELDRLLAQREHSSINDQFVMSRDVWR